MLQKVRWLIVLLLMSFSFTGVFAQDDEVMDLEDNCRITLSDDWELVDFGDTGHYHFASGDIELILATPEQIIDYFPDALESSTADMLIEVFDSIEDATIRRRSIEAIEFAGYDGSGWGYEINSEDQRGTVMILEIDTETFLYVDFHTLDDQLEDDWEVVEAFIETFECGSEGGIKDTSVNCTINTDTADTARLRVGPGEHRTAIMFLPTDEDFTVLGKFTTDDGDVWYKLDKNEIDPKSGAAELWVISDEVDKSGDCDNVAETNASAIIPIIPNPGGGGNTGGDGTTTPPTGDAIRPVAGTWTVTLDSVINASCRGSGNITVPTTDFFPDLSFPVLVSPAADLSSITIGGEVLYLNLAANNYLGSYQLGGNNYQTYILVESPTLITGRFVGNTTFGGVGCSITLYHRITL